jgi:hypothetical protein
MTGPFIPQLKGWADDLAGPMANIAAAYRRMRYPNEDFQRAFQAAILRDPSIINKFADLTKQNPELPNMLGFGPNFTPALQRQPQSAAGIVEQRAQGVLRSDPTASEDAVFGAIGARTPTEREKDKLDIKAKESGLLSDDLNRQLARLNIDAATLSNEVLPLLLKRDVAAATAKIDELAQLGSARNLRPGIFTKIGGRQNVYKAIRGMIPGVQLSQEEAAALELTDPNLIAGQREDHHNDQIIALRKQELTQENDPRRAGANANAQRAAMTAFQMNEKLPMPAGVTMNDVTTRILTGQGTNAVNAYVTAAGKMIQSGERQNILNQFYTRIAPQQAKMQDTRGAKYLAHEKDAAAAEATAIAREMLTGWLPPEEIPVYGKTDLGRGVMGGKREVWGRTNGPTALSIAEQQKITRLADRAKNDPNWEAQMKAAGIPSSVIEEVRKLIGK